MSASVSRPAIAARTTSSCPGRKASKPKRSWSGVARSVRRASIGSASGDLCADFVPISAPADLDRAPVGIARETVVERFPSRAPAACRCARRRGGRSADRASPRRCRSARRPRPARRGSSRTRRRTHGVHRGPTAGCRSSAAPRSRWMTRCSVRVAANAPTCRPSAGTRRSGRGRCRAAARAPRRSRRRTGTDRSRVARAIAGHRRIAAMPLVSEHMTRSLRPSRRRRPR